MYRPLLSFCSLCAASCMTVPPAPHRPPGIEAYETSCNAASATRLIGRARSAEAAELARGLSGATLVRWIAPGEGVTSDYNTARVNLETDARGRIVSVRCG